MPPGVNVVVFESSNGLFESDQDMVRTVPNTPRTSTLKKSHAYRVSQWLVRNGFPCHPLVNRVRDHRDDELERHRECLSPRSSASSRSSTARTSFHSVRWEYGYTFPNYDVVALARAVVAGQAARDWKAPDVRFYTGIPDGRDARWSTFWQRGSLA
jgi:hypothetical protein